MEAAQAHMDDIDNASDGLKLLVELKRYKPGFGFTCKARDIGLDSYVECLEKDAFRCPFSVSYGYFYYCIFLARIHAAKAL
jgi:hypothetical protein